jgi:organic hydroperoxide reductase OsmC/OhrA
MRITARLANAGDAQEVRVRSGDAERPLAIPARPAGGGSAVNGGELLMLALATCYCNDLYREAAARGLRLDAVEVEASAEFAAVGHAASDVRYRARIDSPEPAEVIEALLRETDAVAEVHNTLRRGGLVTREPWSVPGTDPR